MRIVPILFLFSSLSVLAQSDVGPLISVLENPVPEARNCTTADFDACVKAICGDMSRYKRRQEADYEALYDASKYGALSTVREKLETVLEQQRQKNLKFVSELKTQIEAGSFSINTSKWDDFEWDNEAYKLFSESIEWETDPSKPIESKISYRLKNTEGKSPEFIEALKAYAREKQADHSDIRTLVENNLLSESELRTSITSLQSSLGNRVTPELKARIESGSDLSNVAFSLVILRDRPLSAYMCKSPECRANISRHLTKNLLPSLESFREENANPFFVASQLPRCQAAFMQSAVRLPEFEAVKNNLPALRERYINSALAGLSAHSKGLFKKYLEEGVNYSTGVFQDPKASLEASLSSSSKPYSDEERDEHLYNLSKGKYQDFTLGLDACKGALPLEADSFVVNPMVYEGRADGTTKVTGDPNGKDHINISEFNCSHPDLGEGVLFHELGHALSYLFHKNEVSPESRESYTKLRVCITQAADDKPGNERYRGDRLTTEEDMADFLARKIMTSQHPSSCQLVYPENMTIMTQSEDSHSPSMRRLLLDARAKGTQPAVCDPITIQYGHQFGAEKCSL